MALPTIVKQIIVERSLEQALWENLMYVIIVLTGVFVGTTFLSSGNIALAFSISSCILLLFFLVVILIKKGLIINKKLYRGYFLFGKLLYKKEVFNSGCNNFTLVEKKYRQKYVRSYSEFNWEYSVSSFELYFFDQDGAIRNLILKCMKKKNCEKAKIFLIDNCSLKFVSLDNRGNVPN